MATDLNHAFTLHRTYTGRGCAHCGKGPVDHPSTHWMVEGNKFDPMEIMYIYLTNDLDFDKMGS